MAEPLRPNIPATHEAADFETLIRPKALMPLRACGGAAPCRYILGQKERQAHQPGQSGKPTGLLAFLDGIPVGVSLAPREDYAAWSAQRSTSEWTTVPCVDRLLYVNRITPEVFMTTDRSCLRLCRAHGAQLIEAYPVIFGKKPPTSTYMGHYQTFLSVIHECPDIPTTHLVDAGPAHGWLSVLLDQPS